MVISWRGARNLFQDYSSVSVTNYLKKLEPVCPQNGTAVLTREYISLTDCYEGFIFLARLAYSYVVPSWRIVIEVKPLFRTSQPESEKGLGRIFGFSPKRRSVSVG